MSKGGFEILAQSGVHRTYINVHCTMYMLIQNKKCLNKTTKEELNYLSV